MDRCQYRFIVIRDPVKRFLSAYSNRIGHYKELSEPFIRDKFPELYWEMPFFDPGLGQFIDHFNKYIKVKPVNHHFCSILDYLYGKKLDYFTHVYKIEDLNIFEKDLATMTGKEISFGREQIGGRKISLRELSELQLETIIKIYRNDYDLLNEYYNVDDIWEEWRGTRHNDAVPKTYMHRIKAFIQYKC